MQEHRLARQVEQERHGDTALFAALAGVHHRPFVVEEAGGVLDRVQWRIALRQDSRMVTGPDPPHRVQRGRDRATLVGVVTVGTARIHEDGLAARNRLPVAGDAAWRLN